MLNWAKKEKNFDKLDSYSAQKYFVSYLVLDLPI